MLGELSELLPDGTDLDGVLGELSELRPDGTDLDGVLGELPELLSAQAGGTVAGEPQAG